MNMGASLRLKALLEDKRQGAQPSAMPDGPLSRPDHPGILQGLSSDRHTEGVPLTGSEAIPFQLEATFAVLLHHLLQGDAGELQIGQDSGGRNPARSVHDDACLSDAVAEEPGEAFAFCDQSAFHI